MVRHQRQCSDLVHEWRADYPVNGTRADPTSWTIMETGDFDGDGKSDVLWRDTSGNVALWFMNGALVTQAVGIANVPTVWSIHQRWLIIKRQPKC
jgi:hypothetical protein